jgi:EF-P beta-lysylation protein EpmB
MITQSNTKRQIQNWQNELQNVISDPIELLNLLELDPQLLSGALAALKQFPLRVPRSWVKRISKGNPLDPLLAQILPRAEELTPHPDFSTDPLNEQDNNPIPGLLHKYHGRLLLTVTSACAIHCRYCFRRHFPYSENNPGKHGWEKALDYIAQQDNIEEVILSGGDPLVANDSQLAWFSQQIAAIPHVQILRIHTRLPVTIPERITDELLAWFCTSRLKPVLVLHCNHPQELDDTVSEALAKLKRHNTTLLNQTVLLKGVNNQSATLVELSKRLFHFGVMPYYLHLLDKVQGAAHFDITEEHAQQLVWEMMSELPGYLVPKLVREVPGAPCKVQVGIFNSKL